ncbi:hypothetical protein [Terrihalobacillus insolitus]|uniref:hypothetical protein n=1 Tax=Terrihalobacillus insolitus TaxID=2950438 RepID=UPI002340045C|nr:hypothetical protein [Terrihalobacillus insolitus]MDC3414302.1 RNA-directed RNA polymerase catalytic subunit [Terrihalobacillus insolitus]
MINHEFLQTDQNRAQKELDCYEYCMDNTDRLFESSDYRGAAAYLENAARSLRELARMQDDKRQLRMYLHTKQTEGKRQMARMLEKSMNMQARKDWF